LRSIFVAFLIEYSIELAIENTLKSKF